MNRTLIVLLCGLLLLWGSCSNNPTGPGTGQAPVLYAVTDPYPDTTIGIYFIDTQLDSIVDSIRLRVATKDRRYPALGVSPDGSRLYLSHAVIDTKSKSVMPGALSGIPTPDGRRLIYSNIDTFRVIESCNNEVLFETDSLPFVMALANNTDNFDGERSLVYGPLYDTAREIATRIAVFDYQELRLLKVINPVEIGGYDIVARDVAVTRDGGTLFYASSCLSPVFTCIDLETERVVCTYGINGTSSLGITPDDRHVYVTDPGCYMFGAGLGLIQIYAATEGDFEAPIDIKLVLNPCDTIVPLLTTDCIAIHPNGKKAYMSTWDGFSVIVIDIASNTVKKVLCEIGFVNSLVIQNR